MAGSRIDQVLATELRQYSRARLQGWLKEGKITVDGQVVEPKKKVYGGEIVDGTLSPAAEPSTAVAEDLPLDVHFEDEVLLVLRKPAGMVMHIAPGNYSGTMQNALLFHRPQTQAVPRAGIVHRLDKGTSGLVMVAKTLESHHHLVRQLQAREVYRVYDAVVIGVPVAGGTVNAPIGRHPVERKKMAVTNGGKSAVTHYRIARKFKAHCHVRAQLETGRTHQIRVHMAHRRFPLLGDTVYGGRRQLPGRIDDTAREAIMRFPRPALHAAELGIKHPLTGENLRWQEALPEDMQSLIDTLARDLEI